MLREGHCIARCLRGSGGGVWPHDARTVAPNENKISYGRNTARLLRGGSAGEQEA